MPRRRRPFRPLVRLALLVATWPRITLAVCLTITAVSAIESFRRLGLSADQNKLYSPTVPFFRDFLEYVRKFPENEALYVLIEARPDAPPPTLDRWTAAADAIAARLRQLDTRLRSVEHRVSLDQLGDQALLFDEPATVKRTVDETRQSAPLLRAVGEPAANATRVERVFGLLSGNLFGISLGDLGLGADPAESAPLSYELARSLRASLDGTPVLPDLMTVGAATPAALGYFWAPDESDLTRKRHLLLVRTTPRENYASLTGMSETVEAVRAAVRDAAAPFPEFTFGVTGRPALEADEMRTTDRDSTRAEIVALICVFVGLVVVLRSVWLALAAELALGVGVAWTCGWATLTLGELNLLSIVFFLALIGIGMDYLVQVLSRYRAEATRPNRHPRRHARQIWVAVFRQVGPSVTTACLGAAGAFLVSLFTDFRGAASLGLIAGGGLILCLIAGYTFLPALLTVVPLRASKHQTRVSTTPHPRHPVVTPSPSAGRPAVAPRRRDSTPSKLRTWIGPALWITLLLAGYGLAPRPNFNPNLLDLQAENLESVQLIRKLPTWSLVVLSNDLDALRAARAALASSPVVGRTESILSAHDNLAWLRDNAKLPEINWSTPHPVPPSSLPRIAAATANLAAVYERATPQTDDLRRAATELRAADKLLRTPADPARAASHVSEWEQGVVDRFRDLTKLFNPAAVDLTPLPGELKDHLVAADGTYALYLYPSQDLWRQENLIRFVETIEPALDKLPPDARAKLTLTGIAHNIYHSTTSIRASFYLATAFALGLIVLVVLIDLRHVGHTLLAVSVLALGLPMLVLLMGLFGIDWNFANFFGLPILIGAAHEYGVFMVHRYRESLADPRRGWPKWDVADSALLLCAFVTCSSFGFFALLASHKGLMSLGQVMALGSACIYLATVVVVRPILKWNLHRRASTPAPEGRQPIAHGVSRGTKNA
ncbi:MAG TPA: MMPL family transporter [Tepidisphaeraceae bacterium]|nr:MMPL family transporter [Tepidisphaeraceae bacterium]